MLSCHAIVALCGREVNKIWRLRALAASPPALPQRCGPLPGRPAGLRRAADPARGVAGRAAAAACGAGSGLRSGRAGAGVLAAGARGGGDGSGAGDAARRGGSLRRDWEHPVRGWRVRRSGAVARAVSPGGDGPVVPLDGSRGNAAPAGWADRAGRRRRAVPYPPCRGAGQCLGGDVQRTAPPLWRRPARAEQRSPHRLGSP